MISMEGVMLRPHRWSFQQRFMAGFLGCAGVLLYAMCTQYFGVLKPCSLCGLQRVAFVALAAVFVSGAMYNPQAMWVRFSYATAALVMAAVGVAIAARHVWIQYLGAGFVSAFGPELSFMLQSWPIVETLRAAFIGTGECAVIDWTFLGLSMPAWSLISFTVLALWSLFSALAPADARCAR
jgi:disulfide bond formation protein DsbB